MSPEHLVRRYYRHVEARDLAGVLSLFADDAVFDLPDGREVAGRESLRRMYEHVFEAGGPQPRPVRIIASDTDAAAEVEVQLEGGTILRMASFFTLGQDDTFEKVAVYERGRQT